MELAEAAHREALRDIQPRAERSLSRCPGMPDQPAPFFPRDATFGQLFAKLSRCVRQTILLEARLAAGAYDHYAGPASAQTPQATPLAPAAKSHRSPEDRPRLRAEHLEDDLAADTVRSTEDTLTGICAELGAALDTVLPITGSARPADGRTPGRPVRPPPTPPPTPRPTPTPTPPATPTPQRFTQVERAAQLALHPGIPPPR